MKRKIGAVLLCVLFCLCCAACGGKVDGAKTREVASDIYSQAEITAAIHVIRREFRRDWDGCTLKEIYYAGDEESKNSQSWANQYDADEAIMLMSSFDVDSSGPEQGLNPNYTYTEWYCILVRTAGGCWRHVGHGY